MDAKLKLARDLDGMLQKRHGVPSMWNRTSGAFHGTPSHVFLMGIIYILYVLWIRTELASRRATGSRIGKARNAMRGGEFSVVLNFS